MSDSPAKLRWPPPPETAEVKKEQVKRFAAMLNALAIAGLATGLVGPYITAIPDADLSLPVRAGLLLLGLAAHFAARTYLRYMSAGAADA